METNIKKLATLLKELADNIAIADNIIATATTNNNNNNNNGSAVKKNGEFEKVKPLFSSENFTPKNSLPVAYRFQQADNRYYFTISDNHVQFYPSVTTIIQHTHPTNYGIKKLISDKGLDGFTQYMREKADYGTLLHILISEYLSSGNSTEERCFDFDQVRTKLTEFAHEKQINPPDDWEWQLKRDLASLIQFCMDYNVTPLLIEAVLTCQNNGLPYAGAVDLLAEITVNEKGFWGEVYKSGINKGEPKATYRETRKIAIIDFKSGKSGFFPEHATQLHMYARAVTESLNITPQVLLNVAPKNWQYAPAYDMKDQTDAVHPSKIDNIINLFYLEWEAPQNITLINGKVIGYNLDAAVRTIPAAEYILNKFHKNNVGTF